MNIGIIRNAPNKCTHTLKNLLERQVARLDNSQESGKNEVNPAKEVEIEYAGNAQSLSPSLFDLLEVLLAKEESKIKAPNNPVTNYVQSIELFQGLIDPVQLKAWID